MAIESVCTGCGKLLSVADENAGKRARCPACGNVYTVPLAQAQFPADQPPQDFASPAARPASGLGESDDAERERGVDRPDNPPEAERYWMRAVDGTEYGPVDRQTLQRWFREGRVGPGYQLRQSRYEDWRPADDFRASVGRPSGNPFAGPAHDPNPYQPVASTVPGQQYPRADQGVFVLVMGALGIVCCPIFGLVAWVVGHRALNEIQAGIANPDSRGLVQVGYYLGIASVMMFILCSGGQLLLQLID